MLEGVETGIEPALMRPDVVVGGSAEGIEDEGLGEEFTTVLLHGEEGAGGLAEGIGERTGGEGDALVVLCGLHLLAFLLERGYVGTGLDGSLEEELLLGLYIALGCPRLVVAEAELNLDEVFALRFEDS